MSGDPITFEAVVACEFIRQEINGKYILIGTYSGAIVVQAFPTALQLSLFLQFPARLEGKQTFELQVVGPHGIKYAEMTGEFEIESAKLPNGFPTPSFIINVPLSGDILIQYRPSPKDVKDGWQTIKTIPVISQSEYDAIKALVVKT